MRARCSTAVPASIGLTPGRRLVPVSRTAVPLTRSPHRRHGMALTWKARSTFALLHVLTTMRLAPTIDKVLRMPMDKRLSAAPAKRMVGRVPDVPTSDEHVAMRDGVTVRVRIYRPEGQSPRFFMRMAAGYLPAASRRVTTSAADSRSRRTRSSPRSSTGSLRNVPTPVRSTTMKTRSYGSVSRAMTTTA
jgi:hypothetical protein